ncbi:unnamed protein product, partial [Allacma fusca]
EIFKEVFDAARMELTMAVAVEQFQSLTSRPKNDRGGRDKISKSD